MGAYADKNTGNAKPLNGSQARNQQKQTSASRFVDDRPEAIQMREFQELANNSPRNQQFVQLQKMANEHAATRELPIQKKGQITLGYPTVSKQE